MTSIRCANLVEMCRMDRGADAEKQEIQFEYKIK